MQLDAAGRFNALNLCDCRLLGIRVEPSTAADTGAIHLDLSLVAGTNADEWLASTLSFDGSASLRVSIDLWAHRASSDTIEESRAEPLTEVNAGEVRERGSLRAEDQPVASLTIFRIALCPPSGEVVVVARDFRLVAAS